MKTNSVALKAAPFISGAVLLGLWQALSIAQILPQTILPAPTDILVALGKDAQLLLSHTQTTLTEAALGLGIGIAIGFIVAVCMDRFAVVYAVLNPCLVVLQTIPTIALAPLLILWLGYEMLPKVVLVALTTFFPITIALLDGFRSVSPAQIDLLRTMKATSWQIFRYVKVPSALVNFFSGLKISATYAIVAAVIAEWLGGSWGLGVYMIRVRKSYAYDRMFAVIIVISVLSLLLMWLVDLLRKKMLVWNATEEDRDYEEGR